MKHAEGKQKCVLVQKYLIRKPQVMKALEIPRCTRDIIKKKLDEQDVKVGNGLNWNRTGTP
jgi:hypothetical protein